MNTLEHSTRDVVQSPHDKRDGDQISKKIAVIENRVIKAKRDLQSIIGELESLRKQLN